MEGIGIYMYKSDRNAITVNGYELDEPIAVVADQHNSSKMPKFVKP